MGKSISRRGLGRRFASASVWVLAAWLFTSCGGPSAPPMLAADVLNSLEELASASTVGLNFQELSEKLAGVKAKFDRLAREEPEYLEAHPSAVHLKNAMQAYLDLHVVWERSFETLQAVPGPEMIPIARRYPEITSLIQREERDLYGDSVRILTRVAAAKVQKARAEFKRSTRPFLYLY